MTTETRLLAMLPSQHTLYSHLAIEDPSTNCQSQKYKGFNNDDPFI